MTIQDLVEKYHKYRDSYINPKYNETQLRSDFLDPLFELLGWDIKNREGKPTYLREVLLEEGLKAGVNENTKKADYTFRLYSERKFFLEAKKPNVAIEQDDSAAKQVRRYGYTAKLKISVLSNFEYLLIYDCSQPVKIEDNHSKGLLKKYHYTDFPEKIEEIKNLLGKRSVYSGNFDIIWKHIDLQIEKHSIDKYFLLQVNNWRKELASEIYKYKNDVSPQQLNDWTQNYLNRILFLRVCEDRNIEEYQSLLATANNKDFRTLIEKFKNADKKYNSGLFNQPLCDDIIDNIGSVFWNIIHQLYYPESTYSFSILSSDILGNIYEIYLTDRLVIEDGKIELRPKPENVDKDIVTTPTYVINEILRQTVIPYVHRKPATDILQMKMADIACGSGAFLLELYQLLQDLFIDYYTRTDTKQLVPTGVNDYKLSFDKKENYY
jgi:predicted type IV restriction endonuclease